jgi:hypothetical protein
MQYCFYMKKMTKAHVDQQVLNMLHHSMSFADEQKAYLESFTLHADSIHDLDGNSSTLALNERKDMLELQKFLYESQVLLWAFLHSCTNNPNSHDEKDNVPLDSHETNVERANLWQQFSKSLQKIVCVHHTLDQRMFPRETHADIKGEEDFIDEELERSETVYSESTQGLEWKHDKSPSPLHQEMTQGKELNGHNQKTVVFSGKGMKSKQLQKLDSSSPSFDIPGSDGGAILSRKESIGQSILMTELQSRLGRMQRPQEIEVRNGTGLGDPYCCNDHDALVLEKGGIITSLDRAPTNTFTALKGNVISELANALSKTDLDVRSNTDHVS